MQRFIEDLLVKRETCPVDNEYDGDKMGARISAVFVILVSSAFGSFFPILSSRYSFIRMPQWCFFIAKYFGSGVIVATAFIHLLEPASDSLGEECLGGTFAEYPWAFAIALMALFAMFFVELVSFHYVDAKIEKEAAEGHSHSHFGSSDLYLKKEDSEDDDSEEDKNKKQVVNPYPQHFLHAAEHQDPELLGTPVADMDKEQYYGQLVSVFILEFGILFHSVFVGLSLAVAGEEFVTLYIVLVFHQMFEGLGLGSRIATMEWPKLKRWTPWIMALGYTLSTPIAIAIGLGVRHSYPPGSRRALITNGVFDSISAGILFYSGIVELMAHEFLYSNQFKGPHGFRNIMTAFFVMCLGAGLMALLGKWA